MITAKIKFLVFFLLKKQQQQHVRPMTSNQNGMIILLLIWLKWIFKKKKMSEESISSCKIFSSDQFGPNDYFGQKSKIFFALPVARKVDNFFFATFSRFFFFLLKNYQSKLTNFFSIQNLIDSNDWVRETLTTTNDDVNIWRQFR